MKRPKNCCGVHVFYANLSTYLWLAPTRVAWFKDICWWELESFEGWCCWQTECVVPPRCLWLNGNCCFVLTWALIAVDGRKYFVGCGKKGNRKMRLALGTSPVYPIPRSSLSILRHLLSRLSLKVYRRNWMHFVHHTLKLICEPDVVMLIESPLNYPKATPNVISSLSYTPSSLPSFILGGVYRPGGGLFIIWACCSWNLWPILSAPSIYFLTHRETQPDSRWIRDLVVKSSTQESKQWDTRFENIYVIDCKQL